MPDLEHMEEVTDASVSNSPAQRFRIQRPLSIERPKTVSVDRPRTVLPPASATNTDVTTAARPQKLIQGNYYSGISIIVWLIVYG